MLLSVIDIIIFNNSVMPFVDDYEISAKYNTELSLSIIPNGGGEIRSGNQFRFLCGV